MIFDNSICSTECREEASHLSWVQAHVSSILTTPTILFWGSRVGSRRLIVTQEEFIPSLVRVQPPEPITGVAFWSRASVLQTDAVEFDPLPRYQFHPGEAHADERAIDNREVLSSNLRPWTRAPLVYRIGLRSSKADQAGSTPAGCSRFFTVPLKLTRVEQLAHNEQEPGSNPGGGTMRL